MLSPSHTFEGVFSRFVETTDRDDIDAISTGRPQAYTRGPRTRFGGAWRSTLSNNFQNEVRGGANLTSVAFVTDWDFSGGVLYGTALGIDNPVGGFRSAGAPTFAFQNQGRASDVYQFSDNAHGT